VTDSRELILTPAALIPTKRQRWLWQDIIPLGTVTAFAGRGGEGKSTFALHVAASAYRGELPGDLHGIPVTTLIVSHEDDWGRIMNPRLIAAGASLDHVYQLTVRMTIDGSTHETVPALPLDIALIRQAVHETGARILIIDPITSTIGGDLYKLADVRRALDPLVQLAQELDIAVVAIMHFAKGAGNASDKIAGSHAFRDVMRSTLLFATDDETEHRILTVDKGSYSRSQGQSYAFRLRSVDVPTDDGDMTNVAKVEFLGDSDLSVSDIINRPAPGDNEHEDRNAAQAFVLDYLHGRPDFEAPAADVIRAGRAAGFSDQEMKDARRRCRNPRVASQKSSYGAGWVWAVIEGGTQGGEGGSPGESATFATFVPPSADEEVAA